MSAKRIVATISGVLMLAGMMIGGIAPAASASSGPVTANHRDWNDWDDWGKHCRWWNHKWDGWGDWNRGHGRWDRWCWDRSDDWRRWQHHDRNWNNHR
jgi:hypothetical protein